MPKTSDKPAGPPKADKTALSGLLAEENEFDRKSLLRIGSWGVLALGAVALAVVSNQSALGLHREQVAAGDLARQAQQIRELTKESQNETRRLAAAIDTLNNDRDRLYSRVTVLEQGLDSVTGAIAKQNTPAPAPAAPAPVAAEPSPVPSPTANLGAIPQAKAQPVLPIQQAASPPSQSPPPTVAPVASAPPPAPVLPAPEKPRADIAAKSEQTPARGPSPAPAQFASNASALAAASSPPLIAPKSMIGPPDPAAPKLIEAPKPVTSPASPATPPAAQATPQAAAAATPLAKDQDTPQASEVMVQHTEFAVDLGNASSVGGLRALWRGLVKSNAELAELRPIIVVKDSATGFGMQLRLAAGPLHDAAAAAKICAALMENKRACETTVFDGQRLAMAADEARSGEKPAAETAPNTYRHGYSSKRGKKDDTPAKPQSSSLSSLLGIGGKK